MVTVMCAVCGKQQSVWPSRAKSYKTCSRSCMGLMYRITTPNTKCCICGKPMRLKAYRTNRVRHGVVCSKICLKTLQSRTRFGPGNVMYGRRGDLSPHFKGEITTKGGRQKVYMPEHPFCDRSGRVFLHRLIAEDNHIGSPSAYITKNGRECLRLDCDVHHIDGNILNNDVSNLTVVSWGAHTRFHNRQKKIIRDKRGRIVGVVKSGELRETPAVDNPEPTPLNEGAGFARNSKRKGAEHRQ